MGRRTRIALEVLGPPLLGACLLNGVGIARDLLSGTGWSYIWLQRQDYLVVVFWAYLLGVLPSLGYMGVMEWRFARGLNPRSSRTVIWSLSLGFVAGGLIGAIVGGLFDGSFRDAAVVAAYFSAAGQVVGWLLGLLIRYCSPAVRDQSRTGPTAG